MEYNLIEYIKTNYPNVIYDTHTHTRTDDKLFIVKNLFVIGFFTNNNFYKINTPFHVGVGINKNIPVFDGFTDIDKEHLYKKVEEGDESNDIETLPLPYNLFYDNISNGILAIKKEKLYKLPRIIDNYNSYINEIKKCQMQILENKSDIIKGIRDYKQNILNFIIHNPIDLKELSKIYKNIQNETINFQNKFNELDLVTDNYESIKQIINELVNIQIELDKSLLQQAMLENYKRKPKHILLTQKDDIINNIKIYHHKWLNWVNWLSTTQNVNYTNLKYELLQEFKMIKDKFKDLLNHHPDLECAIENVNCEKLKQSIIDIESEINNVLNEQLIQLSIKEYNYNKDSNKLNFKLNKESYELQNISSLINLYNLFLENENTRIVTIDELDTSKCNIIVQNFLAINNIFHRQQTIIKAINSYLNTIDNQIDELKLLEKEIENHISFLNLNSYINDVNLKKFKTKRGIEDYLKNKSDDESDFCVHLFNIIYFWNVNKTYYLNLNKRLFNIYEDILSYPRIYLKLNTKDDINDAKDKYDSKIINRIGENFYKINDNSIDLFNELENNYSIVLINYGDSFSKKSLNIFGDYKNKGILYHELKNLLNKHIDANLSLEYLFEQYYNNNNNDLINNKVSGKIHNLVGPGPSCPRNCIIDETKDFINILPSVFNYTGTGIDINNIDNIDSLFNNIQNYRKSHGRISKIPTNNNSSRSNLYMIFKLVFNNNDIKYITIIDTADNDSPINLSNTYKLDSKLYFIMAPEPIGGVNKLTKYLKPEILQEYQPSQILNTLNESFYINETINHILYFIAPKYHKEISLNDQVTIDKYDPLKYFTSPINEQSDKSDQQSVEQNTEQSDQQSDQQSVEQQSDQQSVEQSVHFQRHYNEYYDENEKENEKEFNDQITYNVLSIPILEFINKLPKSNSLPTKYCILYNI